MNEVEFLLNARAVAEEAELRGYENTAKAMWIVVATFERSLCETKLAQPIPKKQEAKCH